jgi:GNAT superfamily N-acetyltransferase
MPKWAIERLAAHHDRDEFDCGVPVLSEWLRQHASQYDRRDLARTYVLVRAGLSRVFGYYAISTCQLCYQDLPSHRSQGLPRRLSIPAVLMGKLAVDQSLHGQGMGDVLLIDALRRIEHLAGEIGIRAVVVNAIDDRARSFYLHKQFEPLLGHPDRLFLPIQIVRRLGLDPPASE